MSRGEERQARPTTHVDATTVDGLSVRVGMQVWFVHPWGLLTKKKLDKTDLGAWWSTRTKGRIYSTERAAIEAAIVKRRADLTRAKREASAAMKAIAKLQARLAATSSVEGGP